MNPRNTLIAALAAVGLIGGGAAIQQERDVVPGGDPPAVPIVVVATASAGLASAEVICARGFPQRRNDGGYLIVFGQDVIEASPELASGFPLILVNGEPVTVSEEVRECILRRFR